MGCTDLSEAHQPLERSGANIDLSPESPTSIGLPRLVPPRRLFVEFTEMIRKRQGAVSQAARDQTLTSMSGLAQGKDASEMGRRASHFGA